LTDCVGGHSRQKNEKKDRTDRRLAEEQTGKRQSVVVARERGGRTVPVIAATEGAAVPQVREIILPGTVVHADEAPGWDRLHGFYETMRINHSVAFSLDGACTNWAESFFELSLQPCNGKHQHDQRGRRPPSGADVASCSRYSRRVSRVVSGHCISEHDRRDPAFDLNFDLNGACMSAAERPATNIHGAWQRGPPQASCCSLRPVFAAPERADLPAYPADPPLHPGSLVTSVGRRRRDEPGAWASKCSPP
jgi:ISXO2-like transposase domain